MSLNLDFSWKYIRYYCDIWRRNYSWPNQEADFIIGIERNGIILLLEIKIIAGRSNFAVVFFFFAIFSRKLGIPARSMIPNNQ